MKCVAFRISNGALQGEKLPERIKIAAWGDNPNLKGCPVRVTARTLSMLPGLQLKQGLDRVPLDYEHNTVPGTPAYLETSEPRKVAAYGAASVIENDGLYLDALSYTPSGTANAREYVDLSPCLLLDEHTNEALCVLSVALTRAGAMEGVHFFNVPQTTGEVKPMTPEELKRLTTLEAAIADIQKTLAGMPGCSTEVSAMSARIREVEGKVQTFSVESAKRERETIVSAATAQGKVITLSVDAQSKLSLAELQDLADKTPVTVPLGRRTSAKTPPEAGGSLIEQYNAIKDPIAKSKFFREHEAKMFVG